MARAFFVTGSKGGEGKSMGTIALLDYFNMRSRMISLVETDTASPDDGNDSQKDVKYFRHLATRAIILVQSNRLTLRSELQSALRGRAEITRRNRNCALQIFDNEVCNHAPAE
jgi:MinD superfamily P-loop ATPase